MSDITSIMSRASGIIRKIPNHSIVKYLSVGVLAFLADYVVLLSLYNIFLLPLPIATLLGFVTGFCISFLMNRNWVFSTGRAGSRISLQFTEYAFLVVFNMFFTVKAVVFLNDQGITPYVSKIIIMAIIVCWNYAIFRWVIFADNKTER